MDRRAKPAPPADPDLRVPVETRVPKALLVHREHRVCLSLGVTTSYGVSVYEHTTNALNYSYSVKSIV